MGIITSSITYPAKKIANGSQIFANKLRMGRKFSQINGEFAKYMREKIFKK